MSKADEMFEKLNYYLIHCPDGFFFHNSNSDATIHFDTIKKRISCYSYDDMLTIGIELDELQAINQKVKELGWIEN